MEELRNAYKIFAKVSDERNRLKTLRQWNDKIDKPMTKLIWLRIWNIGKPL
jgi:hypothetical protein